MQPPPGLPEHERRGVVDCAESRRVGRFQQIRARQCQRVVGCPIALLRARIRQQPLVKFAGQAAGVHVADFVAHGDDLRNARPQQRERGAGVARRIVQNIRQDGQRRLLAVRPPPQHGGLKIRPTANIHERTGKAGREKDDLRHEAARVIEQPRQILAGNLLFAAVFAAQFQKIQAAVAASMHEMIALRGRDLLGQRGAGHAMTQHVNLRALFRQNLAVKQVEKFLPLLPHG